VRPHHTGARLIERREDPKSWHCSCCNNYEQPDLVHVDLRKNMLPAKFVRFCRPFVRALAASEEIGKERRRKVNGRLLILKRFDSTNAEPTKCYLSSSYQRGEMVAICSSLCNLCAACVAGIVAVIATAERKSA
jgi:hypothetical protein